MSSLDSNPYAAPEAPLTPDVLDGNVPPLAALGWRFVAFWLDYVLFAAVVIALSRGMELVGLAVVEWLRESARFHGRLPGHPTNLVIVSTAVAIFLGVVVGIPITGVALFESSRWQATPGKRLLRLQVVNLQGGRVRFGQALVRTLVMLCGVILYGLGTLPALFTRRRQTLHDLVAKTLVVRGRT